MTGAQDEPYNREMVWQRSLLILEDEPLVASLLAGALESHGFSTGTRSSAVEAKRFVENRDPDGVLIDINLGEGPNGLQFGEWLHREHPDVVQIYLTNARDPRVWLEGGHQRNAWFKECTFMSKDQIGDSETLAQAIDQAFSQKSAQRFTSIAHSSPLKSLTRAELEVLRLIAAGLTNAAIAEGRGTTLRTVEQQIQSLYEALGISESRDRNARVTAARIFLRASGASRA